MPCSGSGVLLFRLLLRRLSVLIFLPGLALPLASPVIGAEILVFAAASMKNALEEVAAHFRSETGHSVITSFAASSALARQIEFGAPAEVFVSANSDWMDYLERYGLVDTRTRFDLAQNKIVLIAHGQNANPVTIRKGMNLASLLGDGRLAMAFFNSAPAGIYGRKALEALDEWQTVRPRVAQADNVRAALALVASGEAPMGIVYATDAAAEDRVAVVGKFAPAFHPPVIYVAAGIAGHAGPIRSSFLDYLRSRVARTALERQGFVFLPG